MPSYTHFGMRHHWVLRVRIYNLSTFYWKEFDLTLTEIVYID